MSNDDKPEGYVFGRPTVYRPEMCQQAIEAGRQGKSLTWIAASFMVSKQTLYRWLDEKDGAFQPDFRDAMQIAMTLAQQWWKEKGQQYFCDRSVLHN